MRILSREARKKIYYIIILVIVSGLMYLSVKYLLPICLPIIIAFFISHILHKSVIFLNRKLRISGKMAVFVVIGIVLTIMAGILVFIYSKVSKQIGVLVKNIDELMYMVEDCVFSTCDAIGNKFGINAKEVHRAVEVRLDQVVEQAGDNFMDNLFANTTGIAKGTIDLIVLLVFVFTAIIYMVKNMNSIKRAMDECYFAKEIAFIKSICKQVFLAYIKAQLVIMLIVAIICTIGLYILKNPYSLSIGLLIAIVDALPLLGASIVLLPWTLIVVLQGNYFYGAMLFTMYVLSYMAREYIEPKIMGEKMGIGPVMSLIAVYVGYTLFGFWGMIIGPFIFVVISRIMKMVRMKLDNN